MRNIFLILCLLLFCTLTACKDTQWIDAPEGTPPDGSVTGTPGEPEEPEKPAELYDSKFINCTYIRGDNLEAGRIDQTNLRKCNDLIFIECRPYANGILTFDTPVNDGTLSATGVEYVEELEGRKGALRFTGAGSMSGGDVLAPGSDHTKVNVGYAGFTFSTYLYIDEWVDGAFIFKSNTGAGVTNVLLKMIGISAAAKFQFAVNGIVATTSTTINLTTKAWHRVAVTFDKGMVMLYVDDAPAVAFDKKTDVAMPASHYAATFVLGNQLKGVLDETCVVNVPTASFGKTEFAFTSWPNNKAIAYWKYNDPTAPGKDSHTWVGRLDLIREKLANPERKQKLRLGVAGGAWVAMVKDATARTTFANRVKAVLEKYNLDGVDLDFEPAEAAGQDGASYSATVVKLREILGPEYIISVSLHPLFYNLSKEAIAAFDFNTFQVYGPNRTYWPMAQFKATAQALINKGYPREKILMGVPFFSTTGRAGEQVAYNALVYDGGLVNHSLDAITYIDGKDYIFNGVNTMRAKTEYVCSEKLGGIMSWDVSLDLPYEHSMSLTRAVQEVFDSYSQKTE